MWALYILIVTMTGSATSAVIYTADQPACENALKNLAAALPTAKGVTFTYQLSCLEAVNGPRQLQSR